jgi:peptidoglycan/LPS O-acetylase OafA/YrhL
VSAFGIVTAAFYSLTTIAALSWKPLHWRGERSFGLYISHMIIQQFLGLYAGYVMAAAGGPRWLTICTACVCSTVGALWTFHWLT